MTKEITIMDMAPLFKDRITAVVSLGCYSSAPPTTLEYKNWAFPEAEVDHRMFQVIEKISGNLEDYPYICVIGIRTLFGIN